MSIEKVKKSEIQTDFFCIICNKFYASASSLCNHNKKIHKNITTGHKNNVSENIITIIPNIIPINQNVINTEPQNIIIKNSLKCEFCNKLFSTRQSKSKHKIKFCKFKNNIINNTTNNINNINNNNK